MAKLVAQEKTLRKLLELLISPSLSSDYALSVSRGLIKGVSSVNVFGQAPEGVQVTLTDIWSRADAVPTQQTWLAPKASRIHTIASSSASDVLGGTGVTSVYVYFLETWDTTEAVEIVSGNLNAGIDMKKSAVIINKMVITAQSTTLNNNVGTITATAAVDATITSVILPNKGRSQSAFLGIPSAQDLHIVNYHSSLHDITGGVGAKITTYLSVNESPKTQTVNFVTRHNSGNNTTGSSSFDYLFNIPLKISGPSIVKMQCIGSAADLDVSAGFDAYLVNN